MAGRFQDSESILLIPQNRFQIPVPTPPLGGRRNGIRTIKWHGLVLREPPGQLARARPNNANRVRSSRPVAGLTSTSRRNSLGERLR